MTKITTMDLNPFYRNAIGIDNLFTRIMSQIDQHSNDASNYPPYNIIKTGEDTVEVQLAIAGFNPGEVNIEIRDNNLLITGEKLEEELPVGYEYTHKGISARKFFRSFTLADYAEIVSATSKNGILSIAVECKIPEAKKPKSIAITYQS